MSEVWANEFREIVPVLQTNNPLRMHVVALIAQDMPGKVVEGGTRVEQFRLILRRLVEGELSLEDAYRETSHSLPRASSLFCGDNRVFASGWETRLVRTQLSRLYNQAILEHLLNNGAALCYVPHSSEEKVNSTCSRFLAGKQHETELLHHRLVESYTLGKWCKNAKIPDHPHCTHVVRPVGGPEEEV